MKRIHFFLIAASMVAGSFLTADDKAASDDSIELSSLFESEIPTSELSEAQDLLFEEVEVDDELFAQSEGLEQKPAAAAAVVEKAAATKEEPAILPAAPAAAITVAEKAPLAKTETAPVATPKKESAQIEISLSQVFSGSPIIYTVLLALSIGSFCIWLYTILTLRTSGVVPEMLLKTLRNKLNSNQYDDALTLCNQYDSFFSKMIASGIASRRHGLHQMTEAMKAEGKRATVSVWQRIALLNDIAVIAPMIGLLGTVLGMFYAFYDLNRSIESVTTLFDGLGISVGTTVAGLLVSIVAMGFHAMVKYRVTRVLTVVENEAHNFAHIIDSQASSIHNR